MLRKWLVLALIIFLWQPAFAKDYILYSLKTTRYTFYYLLLREKDFVIEQL